MARKKLPASGKAYVAANKENETDCKPDMEPEILSMDPWDLSHVEDKHQTGRTGPEQSDYRILAEVRHNSTLHFCIVVITVRSVMMKCKHQYIFRLQEITAP